MPELNQMRTPSFVPSLPNGGFTTPPFAPSTQRPSVAFERRQSPIPTVPASGASTSGPPQVPAGDMEFNPPRMTRMPPQAATRWTAGRCTGSGSDTSQPARDCATGSYGENVCG
jgi:hypothetical protein